MVPVLLSPAAVTVVGRAQTVLPMLSVGGVPEHAADRRRCWRPAEDPVSMLNVPLLVRLTPAAGGDRRRSRAPPKLRHCSPWCPLQHNVEPRLIGAAAEHAKSSPVLALFSPPRVRVLAARGALGSAADLHRLGVAQGAADRQVAAAVDIAGVDIERAAVGELAGDRHRAMPLQPEGAGGAVGEGVVQGQRGDVGQPEVPPCLVNPLPPALNARVARVARRAEHLKAGAARVGQRTEGQRLSAAGHWEAAADLHRLGVAQGAGDRQVAAAAGMRCRH